MASSTVVVENNSVLQVPRETVASPLQGVLRHSVLGAQFHAVSMDQALHIIDVFIRDGKSHQICLSNAYTVALCRLNAAYRNVLNRADLLLADGMSIVWGSRWVDVRLPGRIAGPDLMRALCVRASAKHYKIFLLGSTQDNLEALAKKLIAYTPGLQIVGTYSPPIADQMTTVENLKILAILEACQPDILFVGLSAPKQELWIAQNLEALHVPVSIGVGAAFDFLSGRIPRAPRLLQQYGLEWLYRLWCEPRRLWKRYLLGNAIYLSALFREYLRLKSHRLLRDNE